MDVRAVGPLSRAAARRLPDRAAARPSAALDVDGASRPARDVGAHVPPDLRRLADLSRAIGAPARLADGQPGHRLLDPLARRRRAPRAVRAVHAAARRRPRLRGLARRRPRRAAASDWRAILPLRRDVLPDRALRQLRRGRVHLLSVLTRSMTHGVVLIQQIVELVIVGWAPGAAIFRLP